MKQGYVWIETFNRGLLCATVFVKYFMMNKSRGHLDNSVERALGHTYEVYNKATVLRQDFSVMVNENDTWVDPDEFKYISRWETLD